MIKEAGESFFDKFKEIQEMSDKIRSSMFNNLFEINGGKRRNLEFYICVKDEDISMCCEKIDEINDRHQNVDITPIFTFTWNNKIPSCRYIKNILKECDIVLVFDKDCKYSKKMKREIKCAKELKKPILRESRLDFDIIF